MVMVMGIEPDLDKPDYWSRHSVDRNDRCANRSVGVILKEKVMDGMIYMAGVATCALVLIPCYLFLGRQEYRQGYKDAADKVKAVEDEINRLEQAIYDRNV